MKSEAQSDLTVGQATEVNAGQIITANGQTYSVLPQAQLQSLGFDGQEAIYIPASTHQAVTAAGQHTIQLPGGHTLLTHAGQLVRTPNNLLQGVQTVNSNNQALAVRAQSAGAPQTAVAGSSNMNQLGAQVMQLGMPGLAQGTFPVQIPITTAGGATIMQTIPIPVQLMQTNMMQANGQTLQMIPQLGQQVQAQQQIAQPQLAQIILPNGQVQQVQMMAASPANTGMLSLGATSMTQLNGTPTTTSTWSTSTVTTPTSSIASTLSSAEEKMLTQQAAAQLAGSLGANGLTVVPVSQGNVANANLRQNAAQNALQFAQIQVMQPLIQNIQGLGHVQVLSPQSLASLTGGGQQLTMSALGQGAQQLAHLPGHLLPGGAQIISTAGLQGDGETKWLLQTGAQLGQPTLISGSEEISIGHEGPKTRLRRVACVCPNCKDGERPHDGTKKKAHVCHVPNCNKVYGKTSHLRAHLRWHNGERPFACDWAYCSKKFTRSDELQRHRRTHTGDKKFKCGQCDKRFMRSDHLSKHMKTHSKKKSPIPQSPHPPVPMDTLKALQYSDSSDSSDNEENMLTIPDQTSEMLGIKTDVHQQMQE